MSLKDNLNKLNATPGGPRAKSKKKARKPGAAKKTNKKAASKGNGKAVTKQAFTDKMFAHALLRNSMNATAAYRELKPDVTDKTAAVEGHKRLRNPNVIGILQPLLEELFTNAGIETEYVFRRWLEIAQGSAADYFTFEKGRPQMDMSDMTPAQRANLKKITVSPGQFGTKYSIETYDAQHAVDMIAKHLGLLVDKMAEEDVARIGDLIERGVKRIKATKDLDGWQDAVLDAEFEEVQ